ncbi:hypothetical protein LPJ77_000907 [Coemansia sp. RSA 2523]|nr:hypothetical protein LPJ54_000558 [Coemansia sp. RSA 1824]KAJ1810440.1 hypothetical protein LPJ77_000907 [Coemansia sp. RSA 2523]KAJ2169654.1 hypothetical protein GGH16_003612 [Coemansia sp. RSA 560]KAJ2201159.1 hypothetical protein IW144_000562 [Coemansia sp. RSA 522]KAJ2206031.1 hypothetical protein IW145_002404 [Coemansia sp. RSA 521]KAJ2226763.1 hypothetical protein EV180_002779 [Coemansia sp. RSA 518]KAJ2274313.1 hypothetical protein J3F81_002288 [Coemansia sp. RSA 371]KAJ2292768.1 h
MQAVFRLVLEGLAMFAGSWAAGCVPLYVKMDQGKFSILALFGAGLLIGAALAVILPEGIDTLSQSMLSGKHQSDTDEPVESMSSTIGWSLVAGFCTMFLIDNIFPSHHSHDDEGNGMAVQHDNDSAACLEEIPMSDRTDQGAGGGHGAGSELTLNTPPSPYAHQARRSADDSMSSLPIASPINDQHQTQYSGNWQTPQPQWRRVLGQLGQALSPRYLPSTLIGILVHSCADGLALGAAVAASAAQSSSTHDHTSSLEIIVFLALLMHKAPAAFGLITTLKQKGYASYKLGVWLTVFAISAPLAALLTFAVFSIGGPVHHEGDPAVQPWAGIVMLYSAGTFLYVAMAHTLAEAVHQAKTLRAKAKASLHGGNPQAAALSFIDIGVLLLGVILPPLVSMDHDG